MRARLPNPKRIEPDILFNQIEDSDVNLSLKIEATRLSINHHAMEPKNTPRVVVRAWLALEFSCPIPSPA